MALQHAITLDSGITLPSAYARISGIKHTHNEIVVHVQWWVDAAARLALKPTVKEHAFSVPWVASMTLSQAYAALKQEDFFSDALDV